MQKEVDVGKIIKQGRLKKEMSQKQLAEKIGVQPSLISKWESNSLSPRAHDFIKLVNILEIICDFFPNCNPEVSASSFEKKIESEIRKIWHVIEKRNEES